MKGSGPAFSKPRSTRVAPAPEPVFVAPAPEPIPEEPTFPEFLNLPSGIQASILSKGLPITSLRPAQQLEFAATTLPSMVLSPEFLLPKKVTAHFSVKGVRTSEGIENSSASKIKESIATLIKNTNIHPLEEILLENDYTKLTIRYFSTSKDGTIHINVFMPNIQQAIASLLFNFTRVKNQYDTIMLSKVQLNLYLTRNTDLEYLKELFIGLRWLSLVFKKITWDRNLLMFEVPTNVSVFVNHRAVQLTDVQPEVVQKALLLLKYTELNLKTKRGTTRSTKTR